MKAENQRTVILEIAEHLLREKGYNGWSYQDISSALGIRKASIHYYFPHKEDLGCALISYYHDKSLAYLTDAEHNLPNAKEKLLAFIRLFGQVLDEPHSYCLCGMLTADFMTLPESMQDRLKKSFQIQKQWIAKVIEEGSRQGDLKNIGPIDTEASLFVSSLQGMLLMARLEQDPQKTFFENANRFLTHQLS